MNQTFKAVAIISVTLIAIGGTYYVQKKRADDAELKRCPADMMFCPDGSTIARSGPNCEFGVCKQELPSYLTPSSSQTQTSSNGTTTESETSGTTLSGSKEKNNGVPKTFFKKVTEQAVTIAKEVTKTVEQTISLGIKNTSPNKSTIDQDTNTPSQNQINPNTALDQYNTNSINGANETRYEVINGQIVDTNGNVIYTFPPSSSGSTPDTETHIVNVVPVSGVLPIIGAIPVNGLPGKYYVSENTFGTAGGCVFSNKIYILDTVTRTMTLMYEENNTTLGEDNPRACTSEIFLLATEGPRLIFKYHTIGTNTTCDSSWSEPEKTWFIDVTKINLGIQFYFISNELYSQAERQETTCRTQYNGTTTEVLPAENG